MRRLPDDVQALLPAAARGKRPDPLVLERVAGCADASTGSVIRWSRTQARLSVSGGGSYANAVGQDLARATLGLVLNGPELRPCAGRDCGGGGFVLTRTNRRWCDSAVCGNRSRVRAHTERQRAQRAATRDN